MDNGWASSKNGMSAQEKRKREREEAYEDSLFEDLGEDFRLPINHRPTENLDTDNLEQASVDTQLTSSNIGFKLLQKMGWKGKGLGKEEQGIIEPIKAGVRDPKLGVGKQEQDDYFTSEENIQRKKLDVELEETVELAKKREQEAIDHMSEYLSSREHPLWRVSCQFVAVFITLVASPACFVHIMQIQVVAERELKIQSEVKEIRKTFFCELCNKQYKLAVEFEAHLSSYDHNHKKRFKEMKEMHSGGTRDDRQKREQLRQEREMARFVQIADAQRLQQQQEDSGVAPASSTVRNATSLAVQDQRKTLKFGFAAKSVASKASAGVVVKKTKVVSKVSSVFRDDSEEES